MNQRKRLRLPEYDYSRSGMYFLTVCAKDRAPRFGRVCVGGGALDAPWVELNERGESVARWLLACNEIYTDLKILKYVIMPNHVHILLELDGPSGAPAPTEGAVDGPSGAPAPTEGAVDGPSGAPAPVRYRANERVPALISGMKRMTNRRCGCELWHRGYHEHVVRNDADLLRVWSYIDTNPARWVEDEYFTTD